MKAQTIALAGVALVAVVVLASMVSWRVASAVGAGEPLAHRLYVLAQDVPLNPNDVFTSSYVDTSGCDTFLATVRWSVSDGTASVFQSIDGVNDHLEVSISSVSVGLSRYASWEIIAPFAKVEIYNDNTTQTATASLYCTGNASSTASSVGGIAELPLVAATGGGAPIGMGTFVLLSAGVVLAFGAALWYHQRRLG